MAQHTEISWCDSSLNLEMGCQGCELWNEQAGIKRCYAGNLTERYKGLKGWPTSFAEAELFPTRLQAALRWKDLTGTKRPSKPWLNGYPRLIFLNDLGDTFTESLPLDWLAPYIPAMAASPHIWIILTKRPARMVQFWKGWCDAEESGIDNNQAIVRDFIPPNFWLLTSVTGPENVNRIRELLKLRALGASVLGVSYEPAWGPVDFAPFVTHPDDDPLATADETRSLLDWLISGGESGAEAKPSHPDWFRSARDACQASGTAYFHKQWGEWVPTDSESRLKLAEYANVAAGDGTHHRMFRVGKKAAGALLDGREWREMPAAARLGKV